ncbi:MAG: hypothetical protein BWK76_13290 [Desulfobulbaceae bacterium A2]|nr:MAG: hypothetical protein BWK76_13290 [Desulfobulbaceae bacterium A2]
MSRVVDVAFERNREDMTEAIASAMAGGDTGFAAWFNQTDTFEESFVRGAWDFSFYFITPEVCRYFDQPEDKNCLEIGYGGGRLLQASRQYFRHSYGVDVHAFADKVETLLRERDPRDNFTLFTQRDENIPLPDHSVHYVYSTIVIQHFYSHEIFVRYVQSISRVLEPGGLVNLYFADVRKHHGRRWLKYLTGGWRGYIEEARPPDARTAYNTLWMTRGYVRRVLAANGFDLLGFTDSFKRVPDGYPCRPGSQSGVLAKKL